MRLVLSIVLVGILLFIAPAARANAISIGFDGLAEGQDVLGFYSALGIVFEPGWIVTAPGAGGSGGKSAEIAGLATVNIPLGWSGITSFYYSGGPLQVWFYDQVDGLGSRVGTLDLADRPDFTPAGETFPLFRSVVFNASNGNRVDTVTNGFLVIPEPGAFALVLLGGMAGLALRRTRR